MELDYSRFDLGLGVWFFPLSVWTFTISLGLLMMFAALAEWCWAELVKWYRARRELRLEAQSERLKESVLELAEVLAAERDEASASMLRAHFMTTGRLPDTK